jgi:hypothetical protein
MADDRKRQQNRADIVSGIEAGLRPWPEKPGFLCGAPATMEVNSWPRVQSSAMPTRHRGGLVLVSRANPDQRCHDSSALLKPAFQRIRSESFE